MNIIVGTYDGNLMGWQAARAASSASSAATHSSSAATHSVDSSHAAGASAAAKTSGAETGVVMQLVYAFNAHDGSVRALSTDSSGNTLASGGVDESVRVYALPQRRAVGGLYEHKGAVTCIDFVGTSHMVSGDEDGKICVWRTSDWVNLDTLRAHKSAVRGVAAHPSGRMAVSVARDGGLALWDLTKAKPAYRSRVTFEPVALRWSADGAYFVVLENTAVHVFDGASGEEVTAFQMPTDCIKLTDVAILSDVLGSDSGLTLIAGTETGNILTWRLPRTGADREAAMPVAVHANVHSCRVKCIAVCPKLALEALPELIDADMSDVHPLSKLASSAKEKCPLASRGPFVVSVDSGGEVKIWDAERFAPSKNEKMGSTTVSSTKFEPAACLKACCGNRPTALAAALCSPPKPPGPPKAIAAKPAIAGKAAASAGAKRERDGHAEISSNHKPAAAASNRRDGTDRRRATEEFHANSVPSASRKKGRKAVSFAQ